ncbi:phBC6A51 family helix-turn-helix protein [Paenibacillus antri]|nr:phBC6A51 family helix-turn-helix protein [Paenibacillus antri]
MAQRKKRRKRGRPKGSHPPLTDRQRLAIELMVRYWRRYQTRQSVADAVGVSRMTLYRWLKRKDFNRLYTEEREKMFREWDRQARRKWNGIVRRAFARGDVSVIEGIIV